MSKFQVGDDVRHKSHGWRGEVTDTTAATIRVASGGTERWYDAHLFEHDDPHVPDVDGAPIRVGQLVERVKEVPGEIRRVRNLGDRISSHPEPLIMVEGRSGWFVADQWRVLTADDLVVPLEPDTRDVTLRVTVEVDRDVRDADLQADVREAIYQGGSVEADWSGVTVEVVDDGGHDDG